MSRPNIERVAQKFGKFITDSEIVNNGDKILFANSFGFDSSVCLYLLNLMRKDLDFDIEAVLVKIPSDYYSEKFVGKCQDYWNDVGILTHIIDVNMDVEQLKKSKMPCEICGKVRVEQFRKLMLTNKYNVFASGFSLDDLVYYMIAFQLMTRFGQDRIVTDAKDREQIQRRFCRFRPIVVNSLNQRIILPLLCLNSSEIRFVYQSAKLPMMRRKCCFLRNRDRGKFFVFLKRFQNTHRFSYQYHDIIKLCRSMSLDLPIDCGEWLVSETRTIKGGNE